MDKISHKEFPVINLTETGETLSEDFKVGEVSKNCSSNIVKTMCLREETKLTNNYPNLVLKVNQKPP